jgi:hypothetical protein
MLFKIISRVIAPWRSNANNDAVFRRLRLQQRLIDNLQESVKTAQRRADSAWTAASRANTASVERSIEATTPTPEVNGVPKIPAGTSMTAMLKEYNERKIGAR